MEATIIQSIEKTYRSERPRLLGFIRSKIDSAEEAEDILHDVFVQAIGHINAAQPIENLLGWLYRITRNRIIDLYRRKSGKKRPNLSIHGENAQISLESILAENRINIEDDFIRGQVVETLLDSLEELPEKQRRVFIWHVIEEKTFRDISEQTGISINTLLARKRYAVQFLQKRINKTWR